MRWMSAPVAGIRPEAELLICSARMCMDSERAERIEVLLQQDIDWAYLFLIARSHGMMPLLYWHLNATCPDAVPTASMDYLRDYFHENARRNLYLTGELCRILKLFEANGIFAIPYKGPVLAASVYGNLALREFVDLDLLVHKQDVPPAKELLISQGYQPQFNLTCAQEEAFLQYQCEHLLQRNADRVIVEIQWRIAPRYFSFPLDYERLWERLAPISLAGREVLTLSPEDLLLILCVHGAKHLWERLGWICDVAELIRVHRGMDWRRVLEQAGMLGSERMLLLGLFLASDLLGAALPEEVLQRVQADSSVQALAGKVRQQLFLATQHSPGILQSALFHLRAREHWQERRRYCLRLAITPTVGDWTPLPLPAPLFPLYYLWRPIRVAGQYGLALVRRISAENNVR